MAEPIAPGSSDTSRPKLSRIQRISHWRQLNWSHILWSSLIHAGVILAPFTFTWSGLAVCLVLYLFAGIGITMGYHRLLTHRSFRTPRFVEYALTFLGAFSNQGGPLQWVAVHRMHHQHSDAEGDPHSPRHGRWWAHILWWMPHVPELDHPAHYERYVPDLTKDRVHCFLDRWHVFIPISLGVLLFTLGQAWDGIGLSWLVWGMFVRTTLLYHATWFVNSATHIWGYRNYNTRDMSTNLWWTALITLGEGWHNNHHAFPRSARHGLRWWEVDVTYYTIRMLSFVGLAKQIHVPGKVIRPVGARAVHAADSTEVVPV